MPAAAFDRLARTELAPVDPSRAGEQDLSWLHYLDVALGIGLRLGVLRALT